MPCDTIRKTPQQTLRERMDQIRARMVAVEQKLGRGQIKAIVGKNGAIAFTGITADERDGMTDACIYRRIMSTSGSSIARHMIAKAEQSAGRTVDKRLVGQGVHSHDGGSSWHPKG